MDGHLDVIVRSGRDERLAVYPGLGAGEFADPTRPDANAPRSGSFDLGDIDGDGDTDVIVSPGSSMGAAFEFGQLRKWTTAPGGATFEDLVLAGGDYGSARLVDVNGDGALDLVAVRRNNANDATTDVVWFDNAGGSFSGPGNLVTTTSSRFFEVLDFDGDGFVDFATAANDLALRLSFGLGGGAVTAAAPLPGPAGGALFPMSFQDIDGDGLVDLFPARGSGLDYYRSTSPRTYAAPTRLITGLSSDNATRFLDLNGDGDLDLLHYSSSILSSTLIAAVEQVSPGVFGAPNLNVATSAVGAGIGDLNDDGIDDLILERVTGLQWQPGGLGAASGYFGPVQRDENDVQAVTTHEVVDLDSDGDNDILVGSSSERSLGWIENLGGAGSSVSGPEPLELAGVKLLASPSDGVLSVRATDFEGDGDMDLLYVTAQAMFSANGGAQVLINDGGQVFTPLATPAIELPGVFEDADFRDFNGDGLADVLLVTRVVLPTTNLRAARLYLSLPAGGFAAPVMVVSPVEQPSLIKAADLNGDGLLDLVRDGVVGGVPTDLAVSLNLGGGAFAPAVAQQGAAGATFISLTLQDFDGDGFVDVISKAASAPPSVHRGDGTGNLAAPMSLQAANLRGRVDLVDIDADGDLDLFTTDRDGDLPFQYSEQLPSGAFAPPVDLFTFGVPALSRVIMADLDGDGDPEAVVQSAPGVGDTPLLVACNTSLDFIGQGFCNAQTPNSTGMVGQLFAYGTEVVARNQVQLLARDLPLNRFGLFLGARTFGAAVPLANSRSFLCLTGPIGRYQGPGQVQSSGAEGALLLDLDLTNLALPNGPTQGMAGETWSFQLWHRDMVTGVATSHLTTGQAITLR